jgi:hypothetical protein
MNYLHKILYMSLVGYHGKLAMCLSRIGILYSIDDRSIYRLEESDPELYAFLNQYHIIKDSK